MGGRRARPAQTPRAPAWRCASRCPAMAARSGRRRGRSCRRAGPPCWPRACRATWPRRRAASRDSASSAPRGRRRRRAGAPPTGRGLGSTRVVVDQRHPRTASSEPRPLTGLQRKRTPYNVSLTHPEDPMTSLQLAPETIVMPTRVEVVPRSTRRTSVLVALLFLAATATLAAADSMVSGVLRHADLAIAPAHSGSLTAGALLACFEGPATIAIAVLLFPLLRPHGERLAFGYIALRVAELATAALYVATPVLMMQLGD